MGTTERPEPPSEAVLIKQARTDRGYTIRRAAASAGISEARWRQIENGWQAAGHGNIREVVAPPQTLARMAQAVGRLLADDLRAAGRDDAADSLRMIQLAQERANATLEAHSRAADALNAAAYLLANADEERRHATNSGSSEQDGLTLAQEEKEHAVAEAQRALDQAEAAHQEALDDLYAAEYGTDQRVSRTAELAERDFGNFGDQLWRFHLRNNPKLAEAARRTGEAATQAVSRQLATTMGGGARQLALNAAATQDARQIAQLAARLEDVHEHEPRFAPEADIKEALRDVYRFGWRLIDLGLDPEEVHQFLGIANGLAKEALKKTEESVE